MTIVCILHHYPFITPSLPLRYPCITPAPLSPTSPFIKIRARRFFCIVILQAWGYVVAVLLLITVGNAMYWKNWRNEDPCCKPNLYCSPALTMCVVRIHLSILKASFSRNEGKMLDMLGAEGIELKTLGFHHANGDRIHCVSYPCILQLNRVGYDIDRCIIPFVKQWNQRQFTTRIAFDKLGPAFGGTAELLSALASHTRCQRGFIQIQRPCCHAGPTTCTVDVLQVVVFCAHMPHKTTVINLGHLTKGTMRGTYGTLLIGPQKDATDSVANRLEIEIKKF